MHNFKQFLMRFTFVAAIASAAGSGLAQPGGVTVTDLGSFANTASGLQTQLVTITSAAPVAWFKIRLPRVVDPHRFLDISTSGAGLADTEIAIFTASGLLVGSDDDDGANNFSALSFGLTNPDAPFRVPPVAEPGQFPGATNNGRDGSFSGNSSTGTAADYFIAVTQWDVTFANGFGVTRNNGPATGLSTLLTLRMGTPSGASGPVLNATSRTLLTRDTSVFPTALTNTGVATVAVDVSSLGGASNAELTPSANGQQWSATVPLGPSPLPVGTFPMIYRATNSIGDVSITTESIFVEVPGRTCFTADQQTIPGIPGTTIHTYNTTDANVDGTWTSSCYTTSLPPTGNDVWFRFVPTLNGTLTLSTCNSDTGFIGTQRDTLLGFRRECSPGDVFLYCGDDVGGCGVGTRLTGLRVTANQQYNIAVRAFNADIVNGLLAVTFVPGCDDIDFNNNDVFPEDRDFIDFLNVLAGGDCPTCNDIDFNNNEVFPEDQDVIDFFNVLAGGDC
ncbi:MAG TPA: hypothetical protein VK157_02385 [Phycisphaerales bacterium]|nr:hypothetical protein [Phycisphaerales bacterium]